MPLLKRIQTIAAKVETVVGTPIALADADGVFSAYDIKIDASIDITKREAPGSFDRLRGVPGKHSGKMTFKTALELPSTGIPGWATTLFPACGYVASSQVFTPRSEAPGSNVKTLTMGVYTNGILKSIAGAVGTFKIVCPAGGMIEIEWEFMGVWQAPTDVAIIAPTYPTDPATRFAETVLTYNAVAQCVENLTFDAGNKIVMRECADTLSGLKSGIITDREPTIKLNPEARLVADEDRYQHWITPAEYALSCAITTVANSVFTIAAPKAQPSSIAEGSRDGLFIDDVDLICNKNGANKDEDVSITFTNAI